MISTGFFFPKNTIGSELPNIAIEKITPSKIKNGIGPKLNKQKLNLLLTIKHAISQAVKENMKFINEKSKASKRNILVIPAPLAPKALKIPNSRFFSLREESKELKRISAANKHKTTPDVTKTLIVIGSVKKLYAVSNSAYLVVNVAEILYVQ